MNLKVWRDHPLRDRVIGTLTVDGENECFTLEDQIREIPGEPVEKWKVAGCTAIPRGTYDIGLRNSPHFKHDMPWIKGVPGFEFVYLHPGNEPKDTEGCILVGRVRVGDHIEQSRDAFDDLFKLIKEALVVGERVQIEIT